MTIETKRAEVKDIIIRQKTESDFVDWLTGLKDRSHIEMRLYN